MLIASDENIYAIYFAESSNTQIHSNHCNYNYLRIYKIYCLKRPCLLT